MKKIKQLIRKIIYPHTYSNEAFVSYLRKCGVKIGNNVVFFEPQNVIVDINRARYLTIGNDCKFTHGVKILCHDFSWSSLIDSHNVIIPDAGGNVEIGNNVFVGFDSIILKNVKIGDNVIVGAGSVVTSNIPSNCVVGGGYLLKLLCQWINMKRNAVLGDLMKHLNLL